MAPAPRHPLRRFLSFAAPYRWRIALTLALGLSQKALFFASIRVVRYIIDWVIVRDPGKAGLPNIVLSTDPLTVLLWIMAGWLTVEVIKVLLIYVSDVNRAQFTQFLVFDIRQAMWRHLQRLSLGFHHSRPTGAIHARLMGDINEAQGLLSWRLPEVAIQAIFGLVALVWLFVLSWQLTIVAIIVLPAYVLLFRWINPKIRANSKQLREHHSEMSGHAVERLGAIAVVQSFAQEPREMRQFAMNSRRIVDRSLVIAKLAAKLRAISNLLVQIGSISPWVLGAILVTQYGAPMSVGAITEFVAIVAMMYWPVMMLGETSTFYQQSMASIERVFEVLDQTPAVQDRPGAINRVPGMGRIEFKDVQFAYKDRLPVIRDLSFSIMPGERVAIVGESGAGKSTVVSLISRLYDVDGGSIGIDGIDIREYRVKKLRRSIGIVLQDGILFSGTIRDNLRYGNKRASDEVIVRAAKLANAHDFVMAMPDGYDTIVGQRGQTLSGGQRQRLSIARTIVQDPRILIFDEATSSLDSESENLINEAMQHVMEGRTALVIAHRFSTVVNSDRVLVMKGGELVEQGAHEELLAADGYYRRLFEQQFAPLQELMVQAGQAKAIREEENRRP